MKWIIKLTGRQLWSVAFLCLFVIVLTITCINLLVSKKKVHY